MKYEKSCGCIIVRNNEVLLVKQKSGLWGFPKGHVEGNESEHETAIREVKEETNLDVKIKSNRRYYVSFFLRKDIKKDVVLFLSEMTGGELRAQDGEILETKWVNFDRAFGKIRYSNMKNLFRRVISENNLEDKNSHYKPYYQRNYYSKNSSFKNNRENHYDRKYSYKSKSSVYSKYSNNDDEFSENKSYEKKSKYNSENYNKKYNSNNDYKVIHGDVYKKYKKNNSYGSSYNNAKNSYGYKKRAY